MSANFSVIKTADYCFFLRFPGRKTATAHNGVHVRQTAGGQVLRLYERLRRQAHAKISQQGPPVRAFQLCQRLFGCGQPAQRRFRGLHAVGKARQQAGAGGLLRIFQAGCRAFGAQRLLAEARFGQRRQNSRFFQSLQPRPRGCHIVGIAAVDDDVKTALTRRGDDSPEAGALAVIAAVLGVGGDLGDGQRVDGDLKDGQAKSPGIAFVGRALGCASRLLPATNV